jgi:predicted nucleotide-binding protein (sugar kinase/HSP70/actin superfamily)
MSQTGGGCRATNYLALLKNALKNAGMSQVPVLTLNSGGLTGDTQPGFKVSLSLARKLVITTPKNGVVSGTFFWPRLLRIRVPVDEEKSLGRAL